METGSVQDQGTIAIVAAMHFASSYNHSRHISPVSFHIGRCQSDAAESLPEEQKPECHPFWTKEESNMPLPFDLEEIIVHLQSLVQ
ncbi:hypothetical protein ASZ78_002983 [Callipepla squamata]|uniref:Alpha-ketoglutarate-dependent dioxygenase FTO C-terminal domain-containing protein n=1 Tax=Callipepla squamata TaxID=9009 RepID=A0A226N9U1_CALSU|nr:hypothetical protein ASZ78_002983 [Callipepla squamata]